MRVVVTDASGRIVYVNPRAEQLTGYLSGELLGRRVELLLPSRLRRVHSAYEAKREGTGVASYRP